MAYSLQRPGTQRTDRPVLLEDASVSMGYSLQRPGHTPLHLNLETADLKYLFPSIVLLLSRNRCQPEPVTSQMRAKLCVFNARASPRTIQSGGSTELLVNHLVTVLLPKPNHFRKTCSISCARAVSSTCLSKSRDP